MRKNKRENMRKDERNKRWRRVFILFAAAALFIFLAGCGTRNGTGADAGYDKLKVITSIYPMYDFAKKVGGDKIELENLVPAGTEPHDWEPSTSDISKIQKADVFIYSGAGMEPWVEKVLSSSKHANLYVGEASRGIELIGSGNGNVHDGGEGTDPHVWLSPRCAKLQMENIKNAFAEADPENKDYYEQNFRVYSEQFDALDSEFKSELTPLPKKDIVVTHGAFGYLCAEYGLNQVAIEGPSADSEPDPAKMAEIIDFAKSRGIKVIFSEKLISPKVAETVAKAAGARVGELDPLEGITDEERAAGEDYFAIMRKNLDALKTALK